MSAPRRKVHAWRQPAGGACVCRDCGAELRMGDAGVPLYHVAGWGGEWSLNSPPCVAPDTEEHEAPAGLIAGGSCVDPGQGVA